MAKRAKPGDPAGRSLRSAAAFNRAQDAAEQYEKREALGKGIDPNKWTIPTDCIKVKNDSGANRSRGDVLELVGLQTSAVDPEHLWLTGDTPTAPGQPFAVLRQATPNGVIDVGQVSGVCMARVNVTDATHTYAQLAAGAHELSSSTSGPAQIYYKPSGTGIKDCVVVLGIGADIAPLEYLILEGPGGTVASLALLPWKTGAGWTDSGPNETHSDPNTDGTGLFEFGVSNNTTVIVKRAGWYQVGFDCALSSATAAQGQALSLQIYPATLAPLYNTYREQDIGIDDYGTELNITTEQGSFAHPIWLPVDSELAIRNQSGASVVITAPHFSIRWLSALPAI